MLVPIEEIKKMVREDFEEQKVIYLEGVCKTLNIPYYNGKTHIRKSEMIDRIMAVLTSEENNEDESEVKNEDDIVDFVGNVPENDSDVSESNKEVSDDVSDTSGEEIEKNAEKVVIVEKQKPKEVGPWIKIDVSNHINECEKGTLMAFLDMKGKIRTAALVKRNIFYKKVKLVTEFGVEFIVPYDNVLWVKNSKRWPRGIYNLLKNGGEIIINGY